LDADHPEKGVLIPCRNTVDKKHVDSARGVGSRPEPGRSASDLAVRTQRIEKCCVVGRESQARKIVFLVGYLLNATDRKGLFTGCDENPVEKIADDLVTVCGNPNRLSLPRERADHAGAGIGLARTGWSLHGKNAALKVESYADRRRQCPFAFTLQFLPP
jgi:hypothetical protein